MATKKEYRVSGTAGGRGQLVIDSKGGQYVVNKQEIALAGAVDIINPLTEITTVGAIDLTLADGTEGQTKMIVMVVDGGDATLTPASLAVGTTLTFDNSDTAYLLFTQGAWYLLGGTATVG